MKMNQQIKQIERQLQALKSGHKVQLQNTVNPMRDLKNFMSKQGYKILQVRDGVYKRKDGKETPIKVAKFSNGREYNVTQYRFWKVA